MGLDGHAREMRTGAGRRRGRARTRFDGLVEAWLATHGAANTRSAYRSDLARYGMWCDDLDIDPLGPTPANLTTYRQTCEDGGARPASVARRLSAVGSFLRYAAAHGSPGASNGYTGMDLPKPADESSTRVLTAADARALLAASEAVHPKAALLVRLLMLDGLKLGEAVGADAADLSGRPPRMALRLQRHGETHVVGLHRDTATAVRTYLDGRRSGPLLLGDSSNRDRSRLSRFGADYVLKRVAEVAGLGTGVSANALRRRFVAAAHADGTDIDDIRRDMGHVGERTTRRYLPEPRVST